MAGAREAERSLANLASNAARIGDTVVRETLSPLMVLDLVAHGDLSLVERGLSALTGFDQRTVQALLEDRGWIGVRTLYRAAGFEPRHISAVVTALNLWHEIGGSVDPGTRRRHAERALYRYLTAAEHKPKQDTDEVIGLLEELDALRSQGGQLIARQSHAGARQTRHCRVGWRRVRNSARRKERGYDALVLVPRGVPSVRKLPSDIRVRDLDPREKDVFARAFKDAGRRALLLPARRALPIDEEEPERLDASSKAAARPAQNSSIVMRLTPMACRTGRCREEMPQRARDPLGSFLTALAQFVIHSHRMGRIVAVIARHSDLIGPQVVRSPFGDAFIQAVLNDRAVSVLGRGNSPRSLTYSLDLGRALVLLAEQADTWGQIWHVPSIPPLTPEKLINAIRAAAGMAPTRHQAIHQIRSQAPMLGFGGAKDKAQRRLARDYEIALYAIEREIRARLRHACHGCK